MGLGDPEASCSGAELLSFDDSEACVLFDESDCIGKTSLFESTGVLDVLDEFSAVFAKHEILKPSATINKNLLNIA
ncbi:hypothetical protein [Nitrosomonas nitrosa]|uniref:hypothetical protein n=1 Tax=Nitrosomonas nitrosa TaxID=52442 RepID=UPI000D31A3AD|nr:hypothetical protein [Nitrosomonas nitrosa]